MFHKPPFPHLDICGSSPPRLPLWESGTLPGCVWGQCWPTIVPEHRPVVRIPLMDAAVDMFLFFCFFSILFDGVENQVYEGGSAPESHVESFHITRYQWLPGTGNVTVYILISSPRIREGSPSVRWESQGPERVSDLHRSTAGRQRIPLSPVVCSAQSCAHASAHEPPRSSAKEHGVRGRNLEASAQLVPPTCLRPVVLAGHSPVADGGRNLSQ